MHYTKENNNCLYININGITIVKNCYNYNVVRCLLYSWLYSIGVILH